MAHNKLLDVISYAGDNQTFVHRSEIDNFNMMSQLVVNESQEAIFFKDGHALDLFGPGRYSLKSDNFPIVRNFFGKVFGGKDVFTCSVFFINKVATLDVPWGTDKEITVTDPEYGLIVHVRAYGTLGIRIKDSRKFLVKIVGQLNDYTNQDIVRQVRGMILQSVKQKIASAIVKNKVPILEIEAHLEELSQEIGAKLDEEFDYLGIECPKFYLESVSAEDKDLEELAKAKSAYASKIIGAHGEAESRRIQGYDYRTERQFDVLQDAAQNAGAGNVMAPGLGLGMGFGIGKGVAGGMENAAQAMNPNPQPQQQAAGAKCPQCGADIPAGARFCPGCGAQVPQKRFCQECGAELAADAKFCPQCGKKVG